jgi:hypothetical protein
MHFAPLLYLDPGSGSFLIQLLIAALLGAGVFIGASWNKVKRLFGIKPKTTEDDTDDDDKPDAK